MGRDINTRTISKTKSPTWLACRNRLPEKVIIAQPTRGLKRACVSAWKKSGGSRSRGKRNHEFSANYTDSRSPSYLYVHFGDPSVRCTFSGAGKIFLPNRRRGYPVCIFWGRPNCVRRPPRFFGEESSIA